mmetsp:Transcript_36847/g.35568  ORF Transcript_36847/g.35568 Transcript_36847/m.35568 type:complete len:96 (+) Transcript_36847:1513-1800(+)
MDNLNDENIRRQEDKDRVLYKHFKLNYLYSHKKNDQRSLEDARVKTQEEKRKFVERKGQPYQQMKDKYLSELAKYPDMADYIHKKKAPPKKDSDY